VSTYFKVPLIFGCPVVSSPSNDHRLITLLVLLVELLDSDAVNMDALDVLDRLVRVQ